MNQLYVRKSRKGDWEKVTAETPGDLTFPANVLADILDNENEISVWEVNNPPAPEELDTIVAALHPRGIANLSDVTLRVISGWKVKDGLHLAMRKTKGDSLDSKLNNAGKHWVIQINTVGDGIMLAKAFKDRDPIFYGKAKVMEVFASALAAGRIATDAIAPGLVKKLFEEGHLQFLQLVAKPQENQIPLDGATEASNNH